MFRPEPELLAVFTSVTAGCFSVRTKIPGDNFRNRNAGCVPARTEMIGGIYQVECEVFSARTEIPGDIAQSKREASVGQNRNSWRYVPIRMRGVCRSEAKFLAILTRLNAGYVPARTKIPGGIYQFECEVFSVWSKISGDVYQSKCEASVGQNRNSWQYSPICARGAFRSEPKFLAVFTFLNEMCLSIRTEIPGGISQCKCEEFVGQNQNSWRRFPVGMREVFRPRPKFLAVFTH